jgi:hypothetical protein
MRALAEEGRDVGIMVNAIMPHATTDIMSRAGVNDPEQAAIDEVWFKKHLQQFKPGLREAVTRRRLVDLVTPFVSYLLDSRCSVSGKAFAVGGGRFSQVFVAESAGWYSPEDDITVDQIHDHIAEICNREALEFPESLYDEMELMARAAGWTE